MTIRLPMFPLGSVLLPHAPLSLHIFEPRYRVLMFDCLRGEPTFGVVLIERGQEVGGGDMRFAVGTRSRIVEAEELADGRWIILAVGMDRIRVMSWLPDDPYPLAEVDELGEEPWSRPAEEARILAEASVVRSLSLAAELLGRMEGGTGTAAMSPPQLALAGDPLVASWQLVAAAPLASLDRQHLLELDDHAERLRQLRRMSDEQATMFAHRLGNE
ncbi:MAG: LON peptidase substrate-binding domain-containing protein [Actinomycetota bacterium]|nr:LON peptidase substrate-binding domain-containing protein [Actinomycetota bacterium]